MMSVTKKRIFFLANPRAGQFSHQRVQRFARLLERAGADVTLCVSPSRQEAQKQMRYAVAEQHFTHYVIGGGDGTIADCAAFLVGTPFVLCLHPIGTANVLAHEWGVPQKDHDNVAHIMRGDARMIWPGQAVFPHRTELFVQMAGLGWDGAIVQAVSLRLKRWMGRYAYGVSALKVALFYRPRPFKVICDDGTVHQVVSAIISKGRFYAGSYQITPVSQMGHARFHIILIKKQGVGAIIRLIISVLMKKTMMVPGLSEGVVTSSVRIMSSGDVPTQLDGDGQDGTPHAFQVAKAPLWVGYRE
ncbi:diacylglycerol/lipid kinase family protein [Saccharibacter floricola]|uniref:Sphingosine kinase n=1 Tax=Saccharibacter floricola DSM 15669 TaxID=1123227 RepID=A0ABQ0NZS0_9PROT|nr:diacylglycerol kinase family protein [Saccharibacter floricola]GBQ07148.1 sphingosine kinase [Saccharibacter floricola DSM 15669]